MPLPRSARPASFPARRPLVDRNDGERLPQRDRSGRGGPTESECLTPAADDVYPPWAGRGIVKTRRPLRNTGAPAC